MHHLLTVHSHRKITGLCWQIRVFHKPSSQCGVCSLWPLPLVMSFIPSLVSSLQLQLHAGCMNLQQFSWEWVVCGNVLCVVACLLACLLPVFLWLLCFKFIKCCSKNIIKNVILHWIRLVLHWILLDCQAGELQWTGCSVGPVFVFTFWVRWVNEMCLTLILGTVFVLWTKLAHELKSIVKIKFCSMENSVLTTEVVLEIFPKDWHKWNVTQQPSSGGPTDCWWNPWKNQTLTSFQWCNTFGCLPDVCVQLIVQNNLVCNPIHPQTCPTQNAGLICDKPFHMTSLHSWMHLAIFQFTHCQTWTMIQTPQSTCQQSLFSPNVATSAQTAATATLPIIQPSPDGDLPAMQPCTVDPKVPKAWNEPWIGGPMQWLLQCIQLGQEERERLPKEG